MISYSVVMSPLLVATWIKHIKNHINFPQCFRHALMKAIHLKGRSQTRHALTVWHTTNNGESVSSCTLHFNVTQMNLIHFQVDCDAVVCWAILMWSKRRGDFDIIECSCLWKKLLSIAIPQVQCHFKLERDNTKTNIHNVNIIMSLHGIIQICFSLELLNYSC